jgi:hypothetical protein
MLCRLLPSAAALAFVAAATPGLAHAQATCGNAAASNASCTPAGVNVTTTVLNIVRLSITPASAALTAPTDVDFAGAGTADVDDLGLHSITVRANATWNLSVTGSAWTGTGNNAKAISDLGWSTTGGAPFAAMSGSPTQIATAGATAGTVVDVSYRTAWTLATDTPGTYTMSLTYTVTAP